jgi:5'-3' exonuclease
MRDREVGEVHEMSPMKPEEQLAIVLPTESWHLIPKEHTHVRTFPERCPYFFPVDFEFFSCGKQFFWECEPEIQIPTLNELRNGGSVV